MTNCIIVGLGGFVGAVCRYLIGLLQVSAAGGFPVKTFVINIVGSFVIGMVTAMGVRHNLSPQGILFLKVGFCGGFTTFSSFALENQILLNKGETGTALLYMVLSLALGIGAVLLGERIVG